MDNNGASDVGDPKHRDHEHLVVEAVKHEFHQRHDEQLERRDFSDDRAEADEHSRHGVQPADQCVNVQPHVSPIQH